MILNIVCYTQITNSMFLLYNTFLFTKHEQKSISQRDSLFFTSAITGYVCYIFVQFPSNREQHGCQIRCFSVKRGLLIPDSLHRHANSHTNDNSAEVTTVFPCTRDLHLCAQPEPADPWRSITNITE